MKKIINFRPFFYCFLALFGAILFAKPIFLSNWPAVVLFSLIIVSITTTCSLRKKFKTLLIILLFVSLGLGMYVLEVGTFTQRTAQKNVFIEGHVCQSATYEKKHYVVLKDVKTNGKELGTNIYLTYYGAPYLNEGDNIEFFGNLTPSSCFTKDGNVQSSLYKKGCRFYASKISDSEIQVNSSSPTLAERFRANVKQNFSYYMDEEATNLTYATIFGDKSEIDESIMSNFRVSGIAHILAVSGLHVGLVAGILFWIMKKIKAKSWIQLLVVSAILIFYCYLCSFSPSVIRATLMSICLMTSNVFRRKYDSLSSIGFAGLLILLIRPLYAFDVGFQLSFGCVIGIAIFYRSVYGVLRKPIKKFVLPNFFAKPLAMSISSQFLVLPVLISYFDGVSFLSILANLVVIPLFTFGFTIAFIATFLMFTSPFFGNMFWLSTLTFNVIEEIALWISSQLWSIIPHFKFAFSAFVSFFALLFVSSRLFLVEKKKKLLTVLGLTCLTVLIVGLLQLLPSGV